MASTESLLLAAWVTRLSVPNATGSYPYDLTQTGDVRLGSPTQTAARQCVYVDAPTFAVDPLAQGRVINTCRQGAVDGPAKVSEGKAKIADPDGHGATNANLKVSFFGPFFFGDYWVLDHADDYSWSIVGEGGHVLRRGHELEQVLRFFDKARLRVVD